MNGPTEQAREFRGIRPNLRHAFGGLLRLTARQSLSFGQWRVPAILFIALVVLVTFSVPEGDTERFLFWFVSIYLTLLVPVWAFLSGAGVIREDMAPGMVDYLLIRPVPRPALVGFRFLAHLGCVQLVFLVSFTVLMGVGAFRQIPGLIEFAPYGLLAQVLALAAFTALGFLCGSITARYLVLGLVYAGAIEAAIGSLPIQINRLSILHHIRGIIDQGLGETGLSLWISIGFGMGITVGLIIVAITLFSLREFTGNSAREG